MGWSGYSNYSGDDTQTQHITFCEWAKLPVETEEISNWLGLRKTKIPKEYHSVFLNNIDKVLSKMNKNKFWDEYKAIEWQMLMCLFLDNDLEMSAIIKENGILATEYLLLGDHSADFENPAARRAALRKLLKRVKS